MKQEQLLQNHESIDTLLERAANGDAEAQFQLAYAYAKGDLGLPQDNTQAIAYFEQSAANRNAEAKYILGLAYAEGELGLPQDNTQAVAYFEQSAANGNADAQSILGVAYAKGDFGLPQDDAQAVAYYQQSAENGNADAQYALGVAYAYGELGLSQDNAKAVAFFEQSAANGNANAQCALGVAYADGDLGLPQDDVQAVAYYRQSATNGNAVAQCNLGVAYADGDLGLPQDDAQAVAYYRQSAANGDADAQCNLGVAYEYGKLGLPQDDVQAVAFFEQSAANGNANAQYNLGVAYANGDLGFPQDDVQAVAYYRKSAANGSADAQWALGVAYADGKLGLPQYNAKAVMYYEQSAANGNVVARHCLGEVYRLGTLGLFRDDIKAFDYYKSSAEGDFAPAQFALVKFYSGILSVEDGRAYCNRAAEHGHLGAKLLLANDAFKEAKRQEDMLCYELGKKALHKKKTYQTAYKLYQEIYQFNDVIQEFGASSSFIWFEVREIRREAMFALVQLFTLHNDRLSLGCKRSRVICEICEMIALRLCLELVCQRDERAQDLLLKVLQHARRLSTSWISRYFHLFMSRWNPSLVVCLALQFDSLANAISKRFCSSSQPGSYLSLFEMDYGELIHLVSGGIKRLSDISKVRQVGMPTLQQACIYSFVHLAKTLFCENAPNERIAQINIEFITNQFSKWKDQFGVLPKEDEVEPEEYARLFEEREQRIDEEIKITLMPLQDFLNEACESFRNSTTTVVRLFG